MHSPEQLEKQQVGLRLPRYLVEEIDELTERYSLNRTDIITEAIRSYLETQRLKEFYKEFDRSCATLQKTLDEPEEAQKLQTLDALIDEL